MPTSTAAITILASSPGLSPPSLTGIFKLVPGRTSAGDGSVRKKIIAALPYSLTLSQHRAIEAIVGDLGKPQRMLRMLQGDVGSGKTVVALMAAAAAIEAGRQAALMAPTEILARQHLATIAPLAASAGIESHEMGTTRGTARHAGHPGGRFG